MKKILIVDDQKEVRELVEVTLRSEDFQILHASNGTQKVWKPELMIILLNLSAHLT